MSTKKLMLEELNYLLDQFDVKKGPQLMSGTDPISGNQNVQLRNYRKKMVRLFQSFTEERQVEELAAFRDRLKEKQKELK